MSRNEPSASKSGPPEGEPRGSGPTTWVVGSTETACDHPEEALTRLGGDGLNGYYRCDRCDAGLVVQDEVGELVKGSACYEPGSENRRRKHRPESLLRPRKQLVRRTLPGDVTGLSTLEMVALLALVAAAVYLFYHGPHVTPAGLGTPLAGRLDGSIPPQRDCGPDCVVCPHCGSENAAAYAYCRRCLGRL